MRVFTARIHTISNLARFRIRLFGKHQARIKEASQLVGLKDPLNLNTKILKQNKKAYIYIVSEDEGIGPPGSVKTLMKQLKIEETLHRE